MRGRRLLGATMALTVLLAGCGADSDEGAVSEGFDETAAMSESAGRDDVGEASADMAAEPAAGAADEAPQADGEDAEEADGPGDGSLEVPAVGAAAGRELARTARLVVEVDDVERAASQVAAAAQRAGGFIAESDVRAAGTEDGREAFGVITLRVPATSLDTTVGELRTIGTRVVSTSVSTEDLTDQLTDTRARLRNLETLEAELRELLQTIEDSDPDAQQLLRVYQRVDEVRGQIERLQAQRAGFEDRVALATVTVELQPVLLPAEEVAPAEEEPVLTQALATTRAAFGVMAELAVWFVVTWLPVLAVALGIPALLLWGLLRLVRNARRDDTRTSAAAAPAPPTGEREREREHTPSA